MNANATVRITAPADPRPIRAEIYGHFLESAFFGNIEGGVFDEGSPLSLKVDGPLHGCRGDVIEALRELRPPVVRWPGGNFTSGYWWQDGTGPRDARPRRLESAWGSEESNRFGTPEFLSWCAAVGTQPYLAHSARSVDDAVRWVEYTNHRGDTELTRRRATDGHPDPWDVLIWGVGNEVFGDWQMGHRPVGEYVAAAREHARFMRRLDPRLRLVAVGQDREHWTQEVTVGLGDLVDEVSLHLYGASRHLTDPSRAEFDAVVAQAVYVEQAIAECADTIARARDPRGRPLGIALDEWNMRHLEPDSWPEPAPGPDGGIADRTVPPEDRGDPGDPARWRVNRYSPRTLADALFHAGVIHAMHRTAGREVPVTMANTVNLVNANGVLAVRPDGLVRSPTFHVYDLYGNHFGTEPLAVTVTGPARTTPVRQGDTRVPGGFRTRHAAVDLLDVSAARSADGARLYVAAVNRSADQDIVAPLAVEGVDLPDRVLRRELGADCTDLFAANSIPRPDVVAPRTTTTTGGRDPQRFRAHSITVLEWALAGTGR